jgi:membrane protein DedA with SNARE-associated domain
MPDINQILDTIKDQYLNYGYLILLLAGLIEYIALLGLLWPGGTIIVIGMVYCVSGQLSFPIAVGMVFLGAALGNAINFWLGRAGVLKLIKANRFYPKIEPYMDQAHNFMEKYGRRSLFLSQFIGAVRPFVCIMAGALRVPARQFFIYQLPALLLWNIIFCGGAYLLAHSVKNVEGLMSWFGVAIAGIFAIIWLSYRFVKRRRSQARRYQKTGPKLTSETRQI